MYFTSAQIKALWFIIIVMIVSLAFQYIKILFLDSSPYDFTQFDHLFINKRDSILSLDPLDSIQQEYKMSGYEKKNTLNTVQTIQFPININRASIKELETLPRIGPKMAERIVIYRHQHGLFHTKEDLKKIRGIGDKTFELVKDLVVIE
jgi:competence ComEA-like helix-hairpin-helix protein